MCTSRTRACWASAAPIASTMARSRPSEKFGTLSSGSTPKTLRPQERRAVLAHARWDDAEPHADEEGLAADAEAEAGLERGEEGDDPGKDECRRVLAGGEPEQARGQREDRTDRLREQLRRPGRVAVDDMPARRDDARRHERERAQLRPGERASDEPVREHGQDPAL